MPSPKGMDQCQQWRRLKEHQVQLSQASVRQDHLGSFNTYSSPGPDSMQEPGSYICKTPQNVPRQTFDEYLGTTDLVQLPLFTKGRLRPGEVQ